MANKKITDLSAVPITPTGTELLELVQGGVSYKATAAAIGNSASALPFASLSGRSYGYFYDATDQTGSVTTPTAIKLNTNVINTAGITITLSGADPTRVTFAAAGTYAIYPSLQFSNSAASDYDVFVWLRKNGTDVTASNTRITIPKVADGGNGFFASCFYETVTAGQYVEIMWLPENVALTLDYTAAVVGPPAYPATPSAIVSVERIA